MPILRPFAHAFKCYNIQTRRMVPEAAILCAYAAYLRFIELGGIKWYDVTVQDDEGLAHELLGSLAWVVQSTNSDKDKHQIRFFNDSLVMATWQMLKADHIRPLSSETDNANILAFLRVLMNWKLPVWISEINTGIHSRSRCLSEFFFNPWHDKLMTDGELVDMGKIYCESSFGRTRLRN